MPQPCMVHDGAAKGLATLGHGATAIPGLHRVFADELPRMHRMGGPQHGSHARWAERIATLAKVAEVELATRDGWFTWRSRRRRARAGGRRA